MDHKDEAKKALIEALYLSKNHVDLDEALNRAVYHLSEAAAERAKRELSVTDSGR